MINSLIAGLLGGLLVFGGMQLFGGGTFGAYDSTTNTNPQIFEDDVTLTGSGTDLTVSGDATVSGRNINLTTTNSSTSTFSGGCIQATATSTATPIHFEYTVASTATAINTGSVSDGFVVFNFGACPI